MDAIQYLRTKDEKCKNTRCADCQFHYWDRNASVDGDVLCCGFNELPYEKRVNIVKEWAEFAKDQKLNAVAEQVDARVQ